MYILDICERAHMYDLFPLHRFGSLNIEPNGTTLSSKTSCGLLRSIKCVPSLQENINSGGTVQGIIFVLAEELLGVGSGPESYSIRKQMQMG